MIEPRSSSRAWAIARKYTSVLPLPVTPWSRKVAPRPSRKAPAMARMAADCAGVASWGASRVLPACHDVRHGLGPHGAHVGQYGGGLPAQGGLRRRVDRPRGGHPLNDAGTD